MEKIEIKCPSCGAIKTYTTKRAVPKTENIHNKSCSVYFQKIISEELGVVAKERFASTFRHAKERCCNPNSKDYERYKGKWNFIDYPEFHIDNYNSFKSLWLKTEDKRTVSIDRVDGNLPYQKDNVRWITMRENLQNKPNVKPIVAEDILTGEKIFSNSLGSLVSDNSDIFRSLSAIHSCLKKEIPYKGVWKINYQ